MDRADRSFFMQELLLSMLTPNEAMPVTTNAKKDQSSLATAAQVSQTLAKPIVPDAKQRQTNSRPSPPPPHQPQQSNHVGVPHRFASPPSRNRNQSVMQSQIPQPAANVRKQPKVTDPSN